jgi:hypothetical protein
MSTKQPRILLSLSLLSLRRATKRFLGCQLFFSVFVVELFVTLDGLLIV